MGERDDALGLQDSREVLSYLVFQPSALRKSRLDTEEYAMGTERRWHAGASQRRVDRRRQVAGVTSTVPPP